MKAFFRHSYLKVSGLVKKPKNGVHIMNSHYISPTSTDANVFYTQLDKLKNKVKFIDLDLAVDLVKKKAKVNEPLIAFTYDDGFEECYTSIAPVLESFKVKGGFFINPNFVDGDVTYQTDFLSRIKQINKNPMSWSQIKELHKRGHFIGSHTMDHINLGDEKLLESELDYQLIKSKQVIQEKIGNNCNLFAYPFGQIEHLSSKALSIALEHYEVIFSGTDYKNYYSFNGQVINRRHCEPYWPIEYLNYFLSCEKNYNIRSK